MLRYFPGEEEVRFGRMSRHDDIEYVANGMDYTERSSTGGGVESASVEDKNMDAEEKVSTYVMTRPVAERS
jgi:hypothetical protein